MPRIFLLQGYGASYIWLRIPMAYITCVLFCTISPPFRQLLYVQKPYGDGNENKKVLLTLHIVKEWEASGSMVPLLLHLCHATSNEDAMVTYIIPILHGSSNESFFSISIWGKGLHSTEIMSSDTIVVTSELHVSMHSTVYTSGNN